MQKILIFGTFDGLHPGHRNFFEQAARLGKVFAVVARDSNVAKIKNRRPHFSQRSRLAAVAARPEIHSARLGDRRNFLRPVAEICPDIVALGFDQRTFEIAELKLKLKKLGLAPKIIRLKSFQPKKFKSSLLQKK